MLDDAWDAAPQQPNTLRDTLRGFEKSIIQLFRTAGSLSSVSKNSTSQSYASGPNALTPLQIQRAWRMLINAFDACKAEIDAEGAAVPVDPQYPGNDADPAVYARMQLLLQPIHEYSADLTQFWIPPTIAPPVPFTQ